jgi:hypothetical protein
MRFSAVSPSTSTVMQAPAKINFQFIAWFMLIFIASSSQRRTSSGEKRDIGMFFFAIYGNGTGAMGGGG